MDMVPYSLVADQGPDYLVVSYLLPSADYEVRLVKAPFTPSEALEVADLDFADFDGSTPKTWPSLAWGFEPSSGQRVITFGTPAGGWRWETTGVTNLPQTIYGVAAINTDTNEVMFSQMFTTPVVLAIVNEYVLIDSLQFRFQVGYMG